MKRTRTFCCAAILLTAATLPYQSAAQPSGLPSRESPGAQRPPQPDPLAASRWDLNLDGVFTCEEWKQFAGMVFSRADKNRDGFLNASEFDDLRRSERFFASADFLYFDDDRDRRISRKEFVDRPNPLFVRYDRNNDCRVTAEEMNGTATKNKDKGPPGKGGPGGMGMPGKGAF